jgi:tetratricopeptide (TPR) repeat protein
MKINLSKIKQSRYYLLIVVFTFILYGNSINNEYAMDDNLVTKGVAKVEKGLAGIPAIFSTPMISGKQTYGYRPVVQTTFAIEKQLFKKLPVSQTIKEKERGDKLTQANISHFINVLLYALVCMVLFSFLSTLFKNYSLILPLLVTLLFLVHPLHTEPVDNLKSRDELLMLLFSLWSLKFYLKYATTNHIKYVFVGVLFFLLAALSKKNALGLFGLLPVVLYFNKTDLKRIIISCLSLFIVIAVFVMMKKGLVAESASRDIKFFENPLKFSNDFMDRITVGLYSSWFYLKMLIYPKDLSFYYGFNQIPMANWSYWQVWVSLFFYLPIGIYGFLELIKRNIFGLGIAIWLGLMIGINNVLFPIVGIVADRFAFSLSIGFCIVLGYFLLKVFKIDFSKEATNIKLPKGFLAAITIIVLAYSVRTIARNPNWNDEMTLYNHDIQHLTESAKANALLSNVLYPIVGKELQSNPRNPQNKKDVEQLIYHYQEAIRIDSTYLTSINNLGSVYMNFKKDYDQTIYYCSKAVAMDDDYLEAHFNLGYAYNVKGEVDQAIPHFIRVMQINPNYMQVYQVYNKMVFKAGKLKQGIEFMKNASENISEPKNIYLNIGNLYSIDNYNVKESIVYFVKGFEQDKSDKKLCNHIASLYNSVGNSEKANFYYSLCNG